MLTAIVVLSPYPFFAVAPMRDGFIRAGAPSTDLVVIPKAHHGFDIPMTQPGTWLGKRVEFNPAARDHPTSRLAGHTKSLSRSFSSLREGCRTTSHCRYQQRTHQRRQLS
jgi:hypothetical protein